jgi:hypothetical protein
LSDFDFSLLFPLLVTQQHEMLLTDIECLQKRVIPIFLSLYSSLWYCIYSMQPIRMNFL